MEEITRARSGHRGRILLRGRIFASGALAGLAIIVAAFIVLGPVMSARADLRKISNDGLPLQAQLVGLRTTLADWQFFLEPHLDILAPGVAPEPAQLAYGAGLATTQTAQAAALARSLRRVGYTTDARDLETTMRAFEASITKLTPIAAGNAVSPARLRSLVATERLAYEGILHMTARISEHVSQGITTPQTKRASEDAALGLELFLFAAALDLVLVVAISAIFGIRAGRQERARRRATLRLAYETRLQNALEMTQSESDVYGIVGAALGESLPHLKVEMLIAASGHAHFRRALTNDGDFEGCGVVAPADCPATTGGQALMFPSSRALDACPHLKDRASGTCSAACLPVNIAGRTIGVIHAVGPDGEVPVDADIQTANFTSGRGSERITRLRVFEASETEAHTDPLTGLLNRRSLENQVEELRDDGNAYTVAYGDLDHFKDLNDTFGHDVGDQALRAFSRVLRDSVRPNDIVARYGGEEFVIVLPDCGTDVAVGVLERVRERLALTAGTGHVPPFTVTFGVASTAYASEFDDIVTIADHALLAAKSEGRNRVVIADFPVTSSVGQTEGT